MRKCFASCELWGSLILAGVLHGEGVLGETADCEARLVGVIREAEACNARGAANAKICEEAVARQREEGERQGRTAAGFLQRLTTERDGALARLSECESRPAVSNGPLISLEDVAGLLRRSLVLYRDVAFATAGAFPDSLRDSLADSYSRAAVAAGALYATHVTHAVTQTRLQAARLCASPAATGLAAAVRQYVVTPGKTALRTGCQAFSARVAVPANARITQAVQDRLPAESQAMIPASLPDRCLLVAALVYLVLTAACLAVKLLRLACRLLTCPFSCNKSKGSPKNRRNKPAPDQPKKFVQSNSHQR